MAIKRAGPAQAASDTGGADGTKPGVFLDGRPSESP